MEFGSIADVVASGLAAASLCIAIWANSKSNKSLERSEKNTLGAVLQVWWAKEAPEPGEKGRWGLMILNSTESLSSVHDINIYYRHRWKLTDDFEDYVRPITFLPSGLFFFQHNEQETTYVEPVSDFSNYSPILCSSLHEVDKVEFKTADQRSWVWTPAEGVSIATARR